MSHLGTDYTDIVAKLTIHSTNDASEKINGANDVIASKGNPITRSSNR